jgi:hypothetical protein
MSKRGDQFLQMRFQIIARDELIPGTVGKGKESIVVFEDAAVVGTVKLHDLG